MNLTDLDTLEALRRTIAAVPGLRTARLVRSGEDVELPLSALPAAVLEPAQAEALQWPGVPAGRYHLRHWRLSVRDRAVPGTRAFEALVALAQACRDALAADLSAGDRAEDGPPSTADAALDPPAGATRFGPVQLADVSPGRPVSLVIAGACGLWVAPMVGSALLDGEELFASGPHMVAPGSPARRVEDAAFNGLAGGLALDFGAAPRDLVQTGVLVADSAAALAAAALAVEAFIDGRTHALAAPDGVLWPHCRVERFERLGPPVAGANLHQPYRITYRQMAR
jgi:hypothetical protein